MPELVKNAVLKISAHDADVWWTQSLELHSTFAEIWLNTLNLAKQASKQDDESGS